MEKLESHHQVKSKEVFVTRILKKNEYPPESYFQEEHCKSNSSHNLYQLAHKMEIRGAYDLEEISDERRLDQIAKEIVIRTNITALEIFKIGKLFMLAKPICLELGIRFKKWINENFDFSYETANNFMHVYTNCMGMESIALKVNKSILYKISAPSFPEELREFLFTSGKITKMTDMDLTKLVERYKQGGFDEIQEEIDSWNQGFDMYEQTRFVIDRCAALLTDVKDHKHRIMNKFGYYKHGPFFNYDHGLLPAADEVNIALLNSIYNCQQTLEEAIKEARKSISPLLFEIEDALAV